MTALASGGAVWITGASSGLGRALALRVARGGDRVVASARRADALEDLVTAAHGQGGKVVSWPLDVTDAAAVTEVVAAIERDVGPIAVAVLNAGTHQPILARDFAADKVKSLLDLNVMGTAHCLEPLLPRMIGRRRGRIAIVSSVAGYAGLPTSAGYGASKAGLINMAEALRPELEALGITLQIVNPGFVRTPLTDRNPFPMPFLMEPEAAAEAFYRGLASDRFEIVFPRRLACLMKLLRLLPHPLFFAVTRKLVPET